MGVILISSDLGNRSWLMYLKSLPPSKKVTFICFNESSLNVMKNVFHFVLKFYPDFIDHVGKRLDKKAKVDFKIYDVTNWTINNCNTDLARYLKK